MPYTLLEDGDDIEQQYWPLPQDTWPNYQVLWREFAVPLTGRPDDVQIRQGTDPLLEAMCMAHYSIFYHLGRAHELLKEAAQGGGLAERYDDIFFHMSASTEMVDRFLHALWRIHTKLQGEGPPKPLSVHEVCERAGQFYEKEYYKAYQRHVDSGRSVSIRLHNVRHLAAPLVSVVHAEELAKEVWQVTDRIRSYRNVMTHNPRVGRLIDPDGATHLPKQDKLSDYRLWSSVIYSEDARSDFELASVIVTGLLSEFESCVNELWQGLITLLTTWRRTEQYEKMLPSGSATATPLASGNFIAAGKWTSAAKSGRAPAVKGRTLPSGTAALDEPTADLGDPDACPES